MVVGVVSSQDIASGKKVEPGTVVTVTLQPKLDNNAY